MTEAGVMGYKVVGRDRMWVEGGERERGREQI